MMWIEEKSTKRGISYHYREYYRCPISGKRKTANVTLLSNSPQAKRLASKRIAALIEEKTAAAIEQHEKENDVTFLTIAHDWQQHKALSCKPSTARADESCIKVLARAISPTTKIGDLVAVDCEKFLHTMYYVDGYSFNYTKSALIALKAIMRYAKRKKLIKDVSEFEEITIKQKPMTPDELEKVQAKFLESHELESVILQLNHINSRIARIVEFQSRTGLRIGELLALRVCDYDKANKRIHVNGTIYHGAKNSDPVKRGTPKNVHSIRYVYLDNRCMEILDKLIIENRSLAWSSSYHEQGYIFTSKNGNPHNHQYINRLLRKVHIDGKHVTTHVLRHTHISTLATLGIPIKAIMERVGHHDPRTTLAIYSHVTQEMNKLVIDALNAM